MSLHRSFSYEFADAATRWDASQQLTSADYGKLAWQKSDGTTWCITGIFPGSWTLYASDAPLLGPVDPASTLVLYGSSLCRVWNVQPSGVVVLVAVGGSQLVHEVQGWRLQRCFATFAGVAHMEVIDAPSTG